MDANFYVKGQNIQSTSIQMQKKASTVPRHNEINEFLAKKICKDLEVPFTN